MSLTGYQAKRREASAESTATEGEEMTTYTQFMDQLDSAELLFNVREEQLVTVGGTPIKNRKALINESSGRVMSVVSSRYRCVTNEESFSSFCRAIDQSGIDTHEASVRVLQTDDRSKAMVDFTFPAHTVQVAPGDSTALQLCALNSFDGTTRYITKAGGLRMKCFNGQILGNIVGSYSSVHNNGLDVEQGAGQIVKMVQEFNEAKDYWQKMMGQHAGYSRRCKVYKELLGLTGVPDDDLFNHRKLNAILAIDQTYEAEMGQNVWMLYNVITDYVTHHKPWGRDKSFHAEKTLRSKVERLINQGEFV